MDSDNKRSKIWKLVAWSAVALGGIGGFGGAILAPTYLYESSKSTDIPIESCYVEATIQATQFLWSTQYSSSGWIQKGTEITNTEHCSDLYGVFSRDYVRFEGGYTETKSELKRDWLMDILRRIGVLLLGLVIGTIVALPFLGIFHIVRTLEESRDKSTP